MKKTLLRSFFTALLFISMNLYAQNLCKSFKKLSRPEKCWALKHSFIAKKAWDLSKEVRLATDSMKNTGLLGKDGNGGQLDAFRHSYWMALLVKNIRWRKAYRLGKAHEKGNYLDFKKNRKEEGSIPDYISSEMDLWNNNKGIEIGRKYKNLCLTEIQTKIIEAIQNGKMKIIKKNNEGKFLDKAGGIIDDKLLKDKWKNKKCLVSSDYHKK